MIEVAAVDIRGERVRIEVDPGGTFSAKLGGNVYADRTFDGLIERLRRIQARRAAKVEIPFVAPIGDGLERGVARGRHAGTNEVLVTWDDGTKDTLRPYVVLAGMGDEDLAEAQRLFTAWHDAERAWKDWKEAHRLDLGPAVDKAMREAAEREAAEDLPGGLNQEPVDRVEVGPSPSVG